MEGGASGYFAPPSDRLDPSLFDDSDHVRTSVRGQLVVPLEKFLASIGLHDIYSWIHVWLAGSGITYQWAADRGNGDLDVLVGLTRARFNTANPDFAGMGDDELADWLNRHLREGLWPSTAGMNIGSRHYEVTYYYNAGSEDRIERIHPYAAYDLLAGKWVVPPPEETAGEHQFPSSWSDAAAADRSQAAQMSGRFRQAYDSLSSSAPDSPGYHNASAQLSLVSAQAAALLDSIHHGRRLAFQGGGKGYLDYHNYRWQMAKGNGVVKALSEITGARERAARANDEELYGGTITGPSETLERAMLWGKNRKER